METTNNNSNSKTKAFLAVIGIIGALLFIACVALHVTPFVMADSIIDFAVHHYFLMGFISLTIAITCWKMYTSIGVKIEAHSQKKSFPFKRIQKNRIMLFTKLTELYSKKTEDESVFIKPELVSQLKFTEDDVLKDEESRLQRQRDLQKATVLGNSFKQKVILLFKDYNSKKHLMTTVWHSNTEHISLKGGIVLPVKSIYKIEF